MNTPFQGKRTLVTGGNKGIGFTIVQGLLKRGFEVILAARSLDKAKAAIAQLASPNLHPIELDVSDDRSIDRAIETLDRDVDTLDALINNAGIYPDRGVNILMVSRELLNQTMNTNAFGAIRVTQAL